MAEELGHYYTASGNILDQNLDSNRKQDKPTKIRIVNAINNIPNGDVKKLQGQDGYRLRVGDYRILFDYTGKIIYIEKIGNRGQIYK